MAELGKHIGKEEILAHIQKLKDELNEDDNWGDEDILAKIEQLDDLLSYVDWTENPEFIREDWLYGGFCEFLADSMGSPTQGWPYDFIDWGKAADALAQDYKQVTILGDTYYVRS